MTDENLGTDDGHSSPWREVVLVSMPWNMLQYPSIQLGILSPLIAGAGLSVRALHFNLSFYAHVVQHLGRERFPAAEYSWIGNDLGMGEWVFAVPPFMNKPDGLFRDEVLSALTAKRYGSFGCDGVDLETWLARTWELRDLVPAFLDECVQEILSVNPKAVGFSVCFQQTVPSLALAHRLKERAPHLKIVFGGANCEGIMGETLHRLFPCVDVVVRGEGERVVAPLFRSLAEGREPPELPGICVRAGARRRVGPPTRERVSLEESPVPEYEEYFAQLAGIAEIARIDAIIPVEGSRGCWWGQKRQCAFCGRDSHTLSYRKKPGDRILNEVRSLADRHGIRRFRFNDDIIDHESLRQFIEAMREEDRGFSYYTEIKANQTEARIAAMKRAGFGRVQPGIESLSTPILQLIHKGTTALKNVKLLKWGAQYDLHLGWNFLFGFPGEPRAEYDRMATMIPALSHFYPPSSMTRVSIVRFSPYFRDPDSFDVEILGPPALFRVAYEGLKREDLFDLAFLFEYRHGDEGSNAACYVEKCMDVVDAWRSSFPRSYRQLFYAEGDGRIKIIDRREALPNEVYSLSPVESAIYRACENGASAATVWNRLSAEEQSSMTPERVVSFLDTMVAKHLAFRENGTYLSLALRSSYKIRGT